MYATSKSARMFTRSLPRVYRFTNHLFKVHKYTITQLHTLKIYTSFSIFVVSQGCGKGTDGGAVERRLKKSNDFTLGQVFSEF